MGEQQIREEFEKIQLRLKEISREYGDLVVIAGLVQELVNVVCGMSYMAKSIAMLTLYQGALATIEKEIAG